MRFCFYSAYKDQKGGYTTLLLTLAKELHKQKHEVVIFNFRGGLIERELKKENVEVNIIDLESIDWSNIASLVFSTDVFIITKFEEAYRHLFRINPKVVYYDINDFISSISAYKFGWQFSRVGKMLVQRLLKSNSLFFMDSTGIFNLKDAFGITVENPSFLPIPVNVPAENKYLRLKRNHDAILRLTYIGRSVDWKMMPLKKVLKDCAAGNSNRAIHFSIVVDDLSEFKRYIPVESYAGSRIHIQVTENMLPSSINDFLLGNADIHFAMGTAALDAASLGIPTILVDYSSTAFPENYLYNWLFDTEQWSLGKNLQKISAKKTGMSMQQLLLLDQTQLAKLSEKCFRYVQQNHAAEGIIPKLTEHCKKATFRIKDARRFIPYYFYAHAAIKKFIGFLKK